METKEQRQPVGLLLGWVFALYIAKCLWVEGVELWHERYATDMRNVLGLGMLVIVLLAMANFQIKEGLQFALVFPDSSAGASAAAAQAAAALYQTQRQQLLLDLRQIIAVETKCRVGSTVATVVISARLLKFFTPYPKLDTVSRTLTGAMRPLIFFGCIFLIIFFGYVCAGVMLFGA